MAGWQVSSESHNHLRFIVQIQADSGASAWPAGALGKKRADSAAVQYWMTRCTTALQNRSSPAGTCWILCSAVLRWGSKKGSPEGHRLRSGTWQCQSNVLHFQEYSCRKSQLTGKAKGSVSSPRTSHYAKVSSMTQVWVTHSMPKARLSTLTAVPPCWLGCATGLIVPRSRVKLWNYNPKDLSSRQLS